MALDHNTIQLISALIVYTLTGAAAYWRLVVKMNTLASREQADQNAKLINDRPNYTRVEQMINREVSKVITEEKVYQIINREAYGKSDGKLVEQRLQVIESGQKEILDTIRAFQSSVQSGMKEIKNQLHNHLIDDLKK